MVTWTSSLQYGTKIKVCIPKNKANISQAIKTLKYKETKCHKDLHGGFIWM